MFVCTISSFSQQLTILDKTSLHPIKNVSVVNFQETVSSLSDKNGQIDLSVYNRSDTLLIIHTAYSNQAITLDDIKLNKYVLYLYPAIVHLSETVIFANRWEQDSKELATRIRVITPEEKMFYQPQTSADLLGISDEVFIQKSQLGGGSPMIRGFGSNRVLLVVDGVRMNNAISRHGNLQSVISIDPNAIGGLEVIFGPGSVMYGSDAIGGVMDFHTIEPLPSSDSLFITGNVMGRYSSANFERSTHFDFSTSYKKISSVTSFSYSNFGNQMMGKNHLPDSNYLRPIYAQAFSMQDSLGNSIFSGDSIMNSSNAYMQYFSGYRQASLMQKLRLRASDNLLLDYTFYYSSTSSIPRYDRLIQPAGSGLKYATWYYGPQKWMMHNIGIKYEKENLLFSEFKLNVAYQEWEENRTSRKFNNTTYRTQDEHLNIFSLNTDFYKKISSSHELFYGLEGVYNLVGSTAHYYNLNSLELTNAATRYPNGSEYVSMATYLSYKYRINRKLTLLAGARFSYTELNADLDTTYYPLPFDALHLNSGAPTGSLGLVYNPNEKLQININASSGFRAPNIDDAAKVFDSEPGSVVVPNNQLKPEYIYNLDLGFNSRIGKSIRVDATGFVSYLDNVMVRDDYSYNGLDSLMYDGSMSRVQAIVNRDYAVVYGLHSSLAVDINNFMSAKSTITWMKGFDSQGDPMRHVSPIFGSTHIVFFTQKFKADIYTIYHAAISPENLSIEEHNKTYMYASDEQWIAQQFCLSQDQQFNPNGLYSPAWATLNLKISYQIFKNLNLSGGIENITNELYRPYSSGISAPGRNFIISIKGLF